MELNLRHFFNKEEIEEINKVIARNKKSTNGGIGKGIRSIALKFEDATAEKACTLEQVEGVEKVISYYSVHDTTLGKDFKFVGAEKKYLFIGADGKQLAIVEENPRTNKPIVRELKDNVVTFTAIKEAKSPMFEEKIETKDLKNGR